MGWERPKGPFVPHWKRGAPRLGAGGEAEAQIKGAAQKDKCRAGPGQRAAGCLRTREGSYVATESLKSESEGNGGGRGMREPEQRTVTHSRWRQKLQKEGTRLELV